MVKACSETPQPEQPNSLAALQISAMEQTVHEMLEQLKDLEDENQQLKSKCRVLETSVNCSTQIHGMMKLLDGLSLNPSSNAPPNSAGLAVNPVDRSMYPTDSASPGSGASACGWFGLQSADRQNSNTTSETSGGDTWSSTSGLAYPTQPQLQLTQPQVHDPWQRMGQTRVITTGAVQGPAAGNGVFSADMPRTNGLGSSSILQQQQVPNGNAHVGATGRNGLPAAAQGALGGSCVADRSASNSLQAIFAEAAQQQSNAAAAAAGVPLDAASNNPLAGAATSVEQGMGMYKEFLRQASQLLLQVDVGGPGEQNADINIFKWQIKLDGCLAVPVALGVVVGMCLQCLVGCRGIALPSNCIPTHPATQHVDISMLT